MAGGREYPMTISVSEARSRLFPLIQQVNEDRVAVRITSKNGNAVLVSEEDFESWQETVHLLSSPVNAARLLRAVGDVREGKNLTQHILGDITRMVDE